MLEHLVTDLDVNHVVDAGDIASGNDLAVNVEPRTKVLDDVAVSPSDVADLAL